MVTTVFQRVGNYVTFVRHYFLNRISVQKGSAMKCSFEVRCVSPPDCKEVTR
jgi:hypothetical protein